MSPLCIDLFCGRFGWSAGWLDLGGYVVGFDLEHLPYHGPVPKGADLVLQDVLTLHGSQFRRASLILASPPCPFFSYTAMPWTRARELAKAVRAEPIRLADELALVAACFRIQREASEAAGHHIPMVVENVKGAQPWIGRSQWRYGSFHLWGDVPALMPMTHRGVKVAGMNWSGSDKPGYKAVAFNDEAIRQHKNTGGSWFAVAHNKSSGHSKNPVHDHVKSGGDWFHGNLKHPMRQGSSKSLARRAASAAIAEIPFPLAQHIARTYYPRCAVTESPS